MSKKKISTKHQKLEFPYTEYLFRPVRPYQSREIQPILSKLFEKNMAEDQLTSELLSESERYDQYVNEAVTRYIIIRNVGAFEGFLRRMASIIVDKNGADFSKFFSDYYNLQTKLKEVNVARGKIGREELTKGQFFASQFNFVNPEEIDWVFSRLLGLKFFVTVKRINRYPFRNPYPGSIGFVRNWKKFMKMFEWRNQIVHSMEFVQPSREELRSLCSNTLNFMEQASILLDPPTMAGGNAGLKYFFQVINEEKTYYREEQMRTGKPGKHQKMKKWIDKHAIHNNLLPISTNVHDYGVLP